MVGGWELSWVVIDMDPKANFYNTLSDSNTYEAVWEWLLGLRSGALRQSLYGISIIQYIIPILQGGWLGAMLSCHVTWILKSIS